MNIKEDGEEKKEMNKEEEEEKKNKSKEEEIYDEIRFSFTAIVHSTGAETTKCS